MSSQNKQTHVAAVDLGSNSFHMVIGRIDHQHSVQIVDRLREPVRSRV